MKKTNKWIAVPLAALIFVMGCGGGGGSGAGSGQRSVSSKGNTISAVLGSEPNTIDPALNTAVDAAIYIVHSFEGLYRYADNGQGIAQPLPGQAADAPVKTLNPDGTVTYEFTLRDNLKWSDGSSLTAADFVYTWQRLADPATAADYSYMIDMVKNANEIMAGQKDKSELGIQALDDRTLRIDLINDCSYFFEIAAFPATYPVKQAAIEKGGDQWTFDTATYISNGPYRLREWVHNSYLLYEKNPHYYAPVSGPEFIRFPLMDDDNAIYASYRAGELDFIEGIPIDEVPSLSSSGELKIADYLGTYFVSFNTQKAPFDDWRVRKAFTLVIDRNYIIDQITRAGQIAAGGFVPSGMSDAGGAGTDFRAIGGNYYSFSPEDNVAEAQRLMAEAGYPGGQGFPVAEYLYNTNDGHRAIGEAMQSMWLNALGVNVTLNNQDWAVFLDNRKTGNYSMARDGWIGDYNDPINFLDMFITGSGNNNSQYANPEYDRLIQRSKATTVLADRMRILHEAEDMLVGRDYAVGPIYFYTQMYLLNSRVRGMYYTPLGYFFFSQTSITQ
jgi:oligopeptide transport system substrate-binding protein